MQDKQKMISELLNRLNNLNNINNHIIKPIIQSTKTNQFNKFS